MSEQRPTEQFEERLHEIAGGLNYPPTPNIAQAVRQRLQAQPPRPAWHGRRLAWTGALLLLLALLAVPQVRATLQRILRIGAVTIVVSDPTPSPAPGATATLPPATLTAVPTPLRSVRQLAGQTTLDQAQQDVRFPIRLPGYPADLGPPDLVYLQDLDGPALVLAWLDQQDPSTVRMSLHVITSGSMLKKDVQQHQLASTRVHNQPAVWVRGEHLLQVLRGGHPDWDMTRLVDGNTLIWNEEGLTYRLETDLPLEEAVRVAESLR